MVLPEGWNPCDHPGCHLQRHIGFRANRRMYTNLFCRSSAFTPRLMRPHNFLIIKASNPLKHNSLCTGTCTIIERYLKTHQRSQLQDKMYMQGTAVVYCWVLKECRSRWYCLNAVHHACSTFSPILQLHPSLNKTFFLNTHAQASASPPPPPPLPQI